MSFSKRLYLAAVNMVESSQQATLLDGYVVDGTRNRPTHRLGDVFETL